MSTGNVSIVNPTTTSDLHGKYYTQNYNGKLWIASLTTASAIPAAATNATPNFCIWNPAGSATNIVLVRLTIGFTAGTGVASQIGYSYIPVAGSVVGTGAAMSVFTAVAIRSGQAGVAYAGTSLAASAATVTGTAPSVPVRWKWSNFSQGAPITTTAAVYSLFEDFEGTMVLPPNTAFYLDAGASPAETSMISLVAYDSLI
jgi:hypothetical protein